MPTLEPKIPGISLNYVVPTPEPQLLTGVPVFLGLTSLKSGVNAPQKLTLASQFDQYFDSAMGYLRDAITGFFANGGRICYVIALSENTLDALQAGLEISEVLENVDLVCVPDIMLGADVPVMEMQQTILEHCEQMGDRFLNRLPLLGQQMQRWGNNTRTLESVPIVYPKSVSLPIESSSATVSQGQNSDTIIQRKLDSSSSSPNFSDSAAQINQTAILSSDIPVVRPKKISESSLDLTEITLAGLTDSPTSSSNPSALNLNHLSQPNLNKTSLVPLANPVVKPQSDSELLSLPEFDITAHQPLPIIQAKLQNYSQTESYFPVVQNLNSFDYRQPTQSTQSNNQVKDVNLIKRENLISEIPIVNPQPIISQINLYQSEISSTINSPVNQNQPVDSKTQSMENFNSEINQNHHQINNRSLPLVLVNSRITSPVNPQSLPLAKPTPSLRSNNQQPNLPNRNSISNTESPSIPVTHPLSTTKIESRNSNSNSNSHIDIDTIASQVERKLMRKLVVESERRGKTR